MTFSGDILVGLAQGNFMIIDMLFSWNHQMKWLHRHNSNYMAGIDQNIIVLEAL